jgi:PEP-CTERM motif
MSLGKSFVRTFFTVGALLSATQLRANLLFNGSFESIGGATGSFTLNNTGTLANWTATPTGNKIEDCLVFHGLNTSVCGTVFGGTRQFWVNPGPSPDGGNYVGIDSDANFATPMTQSVSGLTIGRKYVLSFWQASAQFTNQTGATTEQWQVTFGTGAANVQKSVLMNTPSQGSVTWNFQKLFFTATGTTQTISFLALGGPSGLPPFALIDGVDLEAVPEPAALALMAFGLASFPVIRKLRKKRA